MVIIITTIVLLHIVTIIYFFEIMFVGFTGDFSQAVF